MFVDKLDAGESVHFRDNLEKLLVKVFETEYPDLLARTLIPVNNEADSGAEFISYEQIDSVGMAKLISDYANDIPRVDTYGKKFSLQVRSIASAFGFSIQDIRAALYSGVPLQDRKAKAARRADEQLIDSLATFGDASAGIPGFVNNSNVPILTLASWAAATPEKKLSDLSLMATTIRTATNSTESPDTILLPESSFMDIAQTQMTNVNETVLSFFLKTSPFVTAVQPWHVLETAGAGGGKRAIAYERNADKLELHIPQEYEVFPPQQKGLEEVVITHMRCAGVSMYKPLSVLYVDGL